MLKEIYKENNLVFKRIAKAEVSQVDYIGVRISFG